MRHTLPQNSDLAYPVRHEDASARHARCRRRGGQLTRDAGRAAADPEVHRLQLVNHWDDQERVGRGPAGDARADADTRRARDSYLHARAREVAARTAPTSA